MTCVKGNLKDENGGKVYQSFEQYNFSVKTCPERALADLKFLDDHMCSRLDQSDVDFRRSILLFLDTHAKKLKTVQKMVIG